MIDDLLREWENGYSLVLCIKRSSEENQLLFWLRTRYYRLAESGVLAPRERVELIDGTIVPMSPQNLPHSTAILLGTMMLTGRAMVGSRSILSSATYQ